MGFFFVSLHVLFEASTLQISITDQDLIESRGPEAYGFPVAIKNVMCATAICLLDKVTITCQP